jgi:hypothetical protein
MILTGKSRRTRRKACLSANLFTKNPTWTDQGMNPGLHCEKPTTNRLSYGTALLYLPHTLDLNSVDEPTGFEVQSDYGLT